VARSLTHLPIPPPGLLFGGQGLEGGESGIEGAGLFTPDIGLQAAGARTWVAPEHILHPQQHLGIVVVLTVPLLQAGTSAQWAASCPPASTGQPTAHSHLTPPVQRHTRWTPTLPRPMLCHCRLLQIGLLTCTGRMHSVSASVYTPPFLHMTM
jgi:hypothetical protein